MIEPHIIVPYGRPATDALRATISRAKAPGPLSPVTVVVASNFVGLSARRLLGSGSFGSDSDYASEAEGTRGLANVSFVTPFQLAELVGADLLLDTRPITNPVLGAAVRKALADDPGPYGPVAEHEATEAALAALFAELSNVDAFGIESIAELSSTSAQLAVQFYTAIAANLAANPKFGRSGFHTEADLVNAAADRDDLAHHLAPFGHLIWYLPAPITPALGRFLDRALHDGTGASVIMGLTGHPEADEPVLRSIEAAGVVRPSNRVIEPVATPATAGAIVSVTDAPEEVRVIAGQIMSLATDGVPLHRIGVFFPSPDPYLRIIEQQFSAAGLLYNGPDHRRLRDSVAGRTLLAALGLPQQRWRRDRVMALIAGGPLRAGSEPIRPTSWDALSREIGVLRDVDDWLSKIDTERAKVRERLAAPDAARYWHDRIGDLDKLEAFVTGLAERVKAVEKATTWAAKATETQQLLEWLLGSDTRHQSWPESEQVAFERVEGALVRLATLDELADPGDPPPTTKVFVRALSSELDVARGRHGRFGQGVMVGPLSSAVGHDLDAVFVLGAAEGLLPVPRRDDAVLPEEIRVATMEALRTTDARLPDDIRIASIDQLETKSTRLQHQHRAFLAALAAAPTGRATLTFARGSLRSGRLALPSRWLLDSASALAGRPVHATDFDTVDASVVDSVGSFASGIRRADHVASIHERDLAAIAGYVEAGGNPIEHPLLMSLRRGIETQHARASQSFTEFDGNLGGQPVPGPGDRALSASRLESWANCGFRYYLRHVLDLADRDDPERIDDISAMERGSLLHTVLERFIGEAIEHGPPAPTEAWSADQRTRLHAIATEEFEQVEARGRTGRAVHWRVRRDDLSDVLDRFLDADNAFRAGGGLTPVEVELDFGVENEDPLRITLGSGRQLEFRGLADRVDVAEDGTVVVSDYKSGRGAKYKDLKDDPVMAGTTLQLGLYAEAALQLQLGTRAEAGYWLVEQPPGKDRFGYPWTAAHAERFADVLEAITDGIDAGSFAAAPGEWNTYRQTNEACTYCEFDSVCVRNRGEQADAKFDDPAVAVRLRLSLPEPNETGDSDEAAT